MQVKLEAVGDPWSMPALAAGAPKVIVGGLPSTRKKVESVPVAVSAVAVCRPSPVTVTEPVYGTGAPPSIERVAAPGAGADPFTVTTTAAFVSNQPFAGGAAAVCTSTPPVAAVGGVSW